MNPVSQSHRITLRYPDSLLPSAEELKTFRILQKKDAQEYALQLQHTNDVEVEDIIKKSCIDLSKLKDKMVYCHAMYPVMHSPSRF